MFTVYTGIKELAHNHATANTKSLTISCVTDFCCYIVMKTPLERVTEKTCEYEGIITPSPDMEFPSSDFDSIFLHPRADCSRQPLSVARELQFVNEVKAEYITNMHFAFLEGHSPQYVRD